MKTILILYPHWHPVNLAGIHRSRLIGNYVGDFGWQPRVLTVEEQYFEEKPDLEFARTFSSDFQVTRVKAFKITKPRLIGDIGLRAFYQLYKKAVEIIKNEKIDFIWLPIPSFYNSILGRMIYDKTKVPYGIDYIDPWVRDITNQSDLRAKLSQKVAELLEPIAVKKASLISGVSTPYYEPVLKRNFPEFYEGDKLKSNTINRHTKRKMTHIGMPYGFDPNDHNISLKNLSFPWSTKTPKQKNWIYAGAFLPNSHKLLDGLFKSIRNLRISKNWDNEIRLWFIGTGNYPAKSIIDYATDYGLQDIVFEKRERFPFLEILNFLSAADTVMVIGSTEKHYTASKIFQALLSKRPVVAIFHQESSAVQIMKDCDADDFLIKYDPANPESLVVQSETTLSRRLSISDWKPNLNKLDKFSAKESARKLVEGIEKII